MPKTVIETRGREVIGIYNRRSVCHNCGEPNNQARRCCGCGRGTCDGCESGCSNCGNAAGDPRYCSACFDNERVHPCSGYDE